MTSTTFSRVCIAAVGVLVILSAGAQNGGRTEKVDGREVVAHEVLVKFHDATWVDIESAKARGAIVHAKMIGGIGVHRFRSSSLSVPELIALYAEDPKVDYVEPNAIVYADLVPNDPDYSELWNMGKISAPAAWDAGTGSASVTVGVVDTGIDYTHPDLAANVWTAPFAFSVTIGGATAVCPQGARGYNAIRNVFDPMDDNDHGSHVSGTIGAVGNNGIGVAGINWHASLMGLKFLNSRGSGELADAVDAIEFAIQAKQAGAANVRVLSNSWGSVFWSRALLEEIERAYANDILFVCSAGNYARNLRNEYPSTYDVPNILAVAATDANDYLADFSNYGYWSVHLAAPGVNVLSTVRRKSYDTLSGTSMAAPHVSGVAALIASKWQDQGVTVDVDHLRGILINAVDIIDKTPPGGVIPNIFGNIISNGRLNADLAVDTDPAGPGTLFPDFVMRFPVSMKTTTRGTTVDFDLDLASYFGYTDARLTFEKECCGPLFPTFADLSAHPEPSPADFVYPLYVSLGAGQHKTVRMRVQVASSASTGSFRFTIRAVDVRGDAGDPGDTTGPYLYHNDTAYVNVVRR